MNKTKTKWIEIKIDHMTAAEALYWDRTIQLDIVAEALKARSEGKPVPRADRLLELDRPSNFVPTCPELTQATLSGSEYPCRERQRPGRSGGDATF